MPYLELPHLRIWYELDGSENRPLLALSNSLGTDLSMWRVQLPPLLKHFRVLRYDCRGQGLSSVPSGPYTIEQMGMDVIALLDHLDESRVHFCGLSMGGMVGQWLGVHASNRLDRLILSNTAAKIGTSDGWNSRIDSVLKGGMTAVTQLILEKWLTDDFRQRHPLETARVATMLNNSSNEGYAFSCAAVRDMDQRHEIRAIRVPTLIVFGNRDAVTTVDDAIVLKQCIQSSKLLALDGAHLSNIEAAGPFTMGVLDFLLKE